MEGKIIDRLINFENSFCPTVDNVILSLNAKQTVYMYKEPDSSSYCSIMCELQPCCVALILNLFVLAAVIHRCSPGHLWHHRCANRYNGSHHTHGCCWVCPRQTTDGGRTTRFTRLGSCTWNVWVLRKKFNCQITNKPGRVGLLPLNGHSFILWKKWNHPAGRGGSHYGLFRVKTGEVKIYGLTFSS